jgi:putative flavoprotein involved in K+ transport
MTPAEGTESVGYDLGQVATVTLATRRGVTFVPRCRGGRDLHYWLKVTDFDLFPPE